MSASEIAKLSDLYYNPETGLGGILDLIKSAKEAKINLTNQQIRDWYQKQNVNQIWQESRKKSNIHIPIRAPAVGRIQADLIDISNKSRQNQGYKWILTIIDVYSRFAWSFPTKNKSAKEVGPKIISVLNELKNKYKVSNPTLTTDDGGEFKGELKTYLSKNEIPHYIANPSDNTKTRTFMIESFNKNLLRGMFKYMESKKTNKWVDILQARIGKHNNKVHSITRQRPIDVISGRSKPTQLEIVDDTEIGSYVRYTKSQDLFTKTTRIPTFSRDIYRVATRIGARYALINASTYKLLKDSNKNLMLFSAHQLRKVMPTNEPTIEPNFQIEEVEEEILPTNEPTSDYLAEQEQEKSHQRFVRAQRTTGLTVNPETGSIETYYRHRPKEQKRVRKAPSRMNL